MGLKRRSNLSARDLALNPKAWQRWERPLRKRRMIFPFSRPNLGMEWMRWQAALTFKPLGALSLAKGATIGMAVPLKYCLCLCSIQITGWKYRAKMSG